MKSRKILAVVLIVAGVLALVYGGFSYTSDTHEASLGPLEVAIEEKERVDLPVWLGILLIGAGVAALLIPKR